MLQGAVWAEGKSDWAKVLCQPFPIEDSFMSCGQEEAA
jgi:hypothetical protein